MPLDYPFLDTLPAAGTAMPVAAGVAWLRMPLPFALDHINLWLLDDGDGVCAVDTGIALDTVKEAWKSALAGRCNFKLSRQIVTHFHPDHLGLAAVREEAVLRLRADLFTMPRILKRIPQIGAKGFPMSHITSWMVQYPQGRAFREFAREHDRMVQEQQHGLEVAS